MLVIERRNLIRKMILEQGVISVSDLSQNLKVSETTIRRDLDFLEGENILKKTHGGAVVLHQENAEPLFQERKRTHVLEKEEIAKRAAMLVQDKETICLDGGTTTAAMIPYLSLIKDLTVVTNSIHIAFQLQEYESIQVIFIGGILRHRTGSVIGSIAVDTLKGIWIDKLFLSCSGLCPVGGVTVSNIVSLEVRKQMIVSSKELIVLADHTKIGQRYLARVAQLSEVDYIVTDHKATPEQIQALCQTGPVVLLPN